MRTKARSTAPPRLISCFYFTTAPRTCQEKAPTAEAVGAGQMSKVLKLRKRLTKNVRHQVSLEHFNKCVFENLLKKIYPTSFGMEQQLYAKRIANFLYPSKSKAGYEARQQYHRYAPRFFRSIPLRDKTRCKKAILSFSHFCISAPNFFFQIFKKQNLPPFFEVFIIGGIYLRKRN